MCTASLEYLPARLRRCSIVLCCFFLLFPHLYAQDTTKTIIINSARIMEVFKTENKAQHSKNIKDSAKDTSIAVPKIGGHKDTVPDASDTIDEISGTVPDTVQENAKTHVSTEQAQKTIEKKKDSIIVFSGGVSLSVKEGTSVSTIEADKVVYNRSEKTIEAEGNVRYERKTDSEKGEEFSGELLLFNIETMDGVFLDGEIKQAQREKGAAPFTIKSAMVGRDSSSTTGFKDALLSTNTDPEDTPLWSIHASRIWMLPGDELAFFNGYFSIGIVPIFYIPFFYHPADEMIFHPVFGFRSRQGYFVQTTTYLLGRKAPDTGAKGSTSFSNFMKSSRLKKQKRIGLFFKNLDEEETGNNPASIKLIADAYSGLGGLIGIEGNTIPKNTPIKTLDFSLFFGISHTLFPIYTKTSIPFSHSVYDRQGKRHYNKSFLYGLPVPFRYRAQVNFGLSYKPFEFSLSMPFIGDPYFKKDFLDRSEDMNWFNYFLNKDKLAKETDIKTEYSYSWDIKGSIRPSFKKIQPWISTLSFDSAALTVNFDKKTNQKVARIEQYYAPHREFFYPKLFKPEGKVSIAGTILSNTMFTEKKTTNISNVEGITNPFAEKKETQDTDTKNTQESAPALQSPSQSAQKERAGTNVETDIASGSTVPEKPLFADSFMPVFNPLSPQAFDHTITYALSYAGTLSALQETTFATELWHSPQDIKWNEYQSRYYQIKGDTEIKGTLSYAQNLISLSSALTIAAHYQKHPYLRDKTKKPVLTLNDHKANVYMLKNTNTITVNPFVYTDMFKPTSFKWSMSEILVKNIFTGTYEKPQWETKKMKWEKDFITEHTGSAVFGMVLGEQYTQQLAFSFNLPPQLRAYSSSVNFSFPYGTFAAATKLFEKEKMQKKWFWEPFKMELNWTLPYEIKAAQTYIYNIEDKKHEQLHITAGWKFLSAFYTQKSEIPHILASGSGWVPNGTEKKFIISALGLSFSNTAHPLTLYAWKNRIKIELALDSAIHINLARSTDSYFTFAPKINFKIHEFWEFSFGSSSRNDVIARYFQNALQLPVRIPGNTNILTDLLQSFYFWDRAKREASGFKLKSLEIGFTHYLKDWTLQCSCHIKPQLKTKAARKYYDFSPVIAFTVTWNPIGDIKVTTKKKDGTFSVERGKFE